MSGSGFYVSGGAPRYGFKLIEATCSVCGKKFMRSDQHGYHAGGKYQCSYSCFRIPEEEERRKFREALDKTLESIVKSDEQSMKALHDKRKARQNSPEYKLEKAQRRAERCEAMISMYRERIQRLPRGVKQRREAIDAMSRWSKSLKDVCEEIVRLKKEMEANKNVHTSEEETAG